MLEVIMLEKKKVSIIAGMPGSGKTIYAIKLAYELKYILFTT
jgi:KaiC/GvpD/RAD55 family RecA-like ATPase